MTGRLLRPELVHVDEHLGVFLLEQVPLIEIVHGAAGKSRLKALRWRAGESDERQAVLGQQRFDLRNGELMLLNVEKKVAAFAHGVEV